jgi:hypothetical protein
MKLTISIFDAITNETIEREMTDDEIAAHKAGELETQELRKAEELAKLEKQTNREALLTKLGITAEEAVLLLS